MGASRRAARATPAANSAAPAQGDDCAWGRRRWNALAASPRSARLTPPRNPSTSPPTIPSQSRVLAEWVAQAREQGYVALDTGDQCARPQSRRSRGHFARAPSPGAPPMCRCSIAAIPICSAAAWCRGRSRLTDALAVLKPLLEDRSVLKIGQDIKYDWVILKRHGIDMRPFDDTMLISYVLDAGKGPHGMDELAKRHLGHTPMTWGEVAGTGKSKVTFDRVDLDKATAYAAEDADVTLRLWQVLKPRLPAEGRATPLRDARAASHRRDRPHGDARHLRRSADPQPPLGRFRPVARAPRRRDSGDRGREDQSRLAQADRRYPVRQDGPAGRQENAVRPMGDARDPAG